MLDDQLERSSLPFSQARLNAIFHMDDSNPLHVKSRESGCLEFKEAFNWASRVEYARTCAAFANARGGYIVFGVTNRPRLLKGLQNSRFDDIDSATIAEFLNEALSPEIEWEGTAHEFMGMKFGILYVSEAVVKPVIALKSQDRISEGDIYYRYRGRSQRIRYPELRQILEEQRQREQKAWLRHLTQISKVGVINAAVLDTCSGKITGPGGTIVIDESLLPKIKFLREGEFREVGGAPALKLIGDVEVMAKGIVQPTREIVRTKGIRTPDIIAAFLAKDKVSDPEDYITQICFESSGFLPVYYFARLAGLNEADLLELIKGVKSTTQAKGKLIERIENGRSDGYPIGKTPIQSNMKRREYQQRMIDRKVTVDHPGDMKYVLQAVRTLSRSEIDETYICQLLKGWFDQYYADKRMRLTDELRKAICYLDCMLYGYGTHPTGS